MGADEAGPAGDKRFQNASSRGRMPRAHHRSPKKRRRGIAPPMRKLKRRALRGQLRRHHWLVDPSEQCSSFLPVQLAIRVNLSAHPALSNEHLLERIPLVHEPSTTLLAAGSNHRALLLGRVDASNSKAPYHPAISRKLILR